MSYISFISCCCCWLLFIFIVLEPCFPGIFVFVVLVVFVVDVCCEL